MSEMINESVQSEITQRIYDAIIDTTLWEPLLQRIAKEMGCDQGMLALRMPTTDDPGVIYYPNADDTAVRTFPYYFMRFPEMVQTFMGCRVGEVLELRQSINPNILERSEFYNDWAQPQGQFDGLASKVFHRGPDVSMLVIPLPNSHPDVTQEQRLFVERLAPHFRQAVRILRHIEWVELQRQDRDQILNRLAVGIVMVDDKGRLQDANKAGWKILQSASGLKLFRQSVGAERPSEDRALRRLIAMTARTSNGAPSHSGDTLSVSRNDGRRDLSVTVAPIPRETAGIWSDRRPSIALFIVDPDDADPSLQGQLMATLHITQRQAEIVAALVRGYSLDEAADILQISVGTARNYLKDAFQRTETHRQGELVALAMRSLAPLSRQ